MYFMWAVVLEYYGREGLGKMEGMGGGHGSVQLECSSCNFWCAAHLELWHWSLLTFKTTDTYSYAVVALYLQ